MDDLLWERSKPLVKIDIAALREVLAMFDRTLAVDSLQPVTVGCRNSNYILETNKGKFFLRLIESCANSEEMAYQLLENKVAMPKLLFAGGLGDKRFLLYACIAGRSLQRYIQEQGGCAPEIAAQAAEMAAAIHSLPPEKMAGVKYFTPPPFSDWFPFFLSSQRAQEALGEKLLMRVRRVLERHADLLRVIGDLNAVPIHGDFRPANMLVDTAGKLHVVDWEGFGTGHALGDVGQFFRFRSAFTPQCFAAFAASYNCRAASPLPENWAKLALIRDLVNPLQMLGLEWDAPRARADFLTLIEKTIAYFEQDET